MPKLPLDIHDLLMGLPGALKQGGIDITPQSHREYVNRQAPRRPQEVSPLDVITRTDIDHHPFAGLNVGATKPGYREVFDFLDQHKLPIALDWKDYRRAMFDLIMSENLSTNDLVSLAMKIGWKPKWGTDTTNTETLDSILNYVSKSIADISVS